MSMISSSATRVRIFIAMGLSREMALISSSSLSSTDSADSRACAARLPRERLLFTKERGCERAEAVSSC